MDDRLVAWARAVKSRRGRSALPPLWLFTDPVRMPDLPKTVAALPAGLCGVVFRHDLVPDRMELLRLVSRLCRARRLALVVAGGGPLPAAAGRHLREGRGPRSGRGFSTSSAHGRSGLVRARRAGAALVFLSPAFDTASHPGVRPWGLWRWALAARQAAMPIAALGGIDGRSVRRMPAWVGSVGAIGALVD